MTSYKVIYTYIIIVIYKLTSLYRAARRACLAAQARLGTRVVPSPSPVSSGPCRAWAVPGHLCLGRATGPRAFCSSITPGDEPKPGMA